MSPFLSSGTVPDLEQVLVQVVSGWEVNLKIECVLLCMTSLSCAVLLQPWKSDPLGYFDPVSTLLVLRLSEFATKFGIFRGRRHG